MAWTRRGVVLSPPGSEWGRTHAALPILDRRPDGTDRVYFSTRDAENRARVAYADVDLEAGRPLRYASRPVLGLGALGAFDDCGVTCSCLVDHGDGRRFLYYSGWSRGQTVPFYFYVGCAISEDDGETFERVSPGPVLERDEHDPYLTASPSIIVEGGTWRMWYCSGTGWDPGDPPRPRYLIRYAESSDGVHWTRTGHVCIAPASDQETNMGRPHVVRENGRYRMWFSVRGDAYRIGYAESADGLRWERIDAEWGLTAASGWESTMVEYPWVYRRDGRLAMLYNGDGFGATGIGLAVEDRGSG